MLEKIVSGGQTGADRAALDVAIELSFRHGGWIPKGRKTEAGRLPAKYDLKEMPTDSYPKRTEQNVIDSDGTMIVCHGPLTGGSEYTRKMADKPDKPWIHVDMSRISIDAAVEFVRAWINGSDVKVLNVAGPRASKDPKIYTTVRKILTAVLVANDPKGRPYFEKFVREEIGHAELTPGLSLIDPLVLVISRAEVEAMDTSAALGVLKKLTESPDTAREFVERVDISFYGYDRTR